MISEKEFLSFINDKSLDSSLEENLNKIIDSELEKSEEEMDTDLIEFCLNRLKLLKDSEKAELRIEEKDEFDDKPIKTGLKIKKIAAFVAVIFVLLAGTISVSSIVFDVNLFDGLIEFYNDYIRINFDKVEDEAENYELLNTEIAQELAKNGFEKVLLPEAILADNYKISNIEYEKSKYVISATIQFKRYFKKGTICINRYYFDDLMPGAEYLGVTGKVEKIENKNTTVYCIEQNNTVSINYRDGLYLYIILLPMDLDEAVKVAKTIK